MQSQGGKDTSISWIWRPIGFVDKDTVCHMNCDMLCDGEEPAKLALAYVAHFAQ